MRILSLIFTILIFNLTASQAVVTVGSVNDAQCDYNTIQGAIDGEAEFEVIRIVSGLSVNNRIQYNENLILNKSHTLFGGFSDCTNAANNTLLMNPLLINLMGTGSGTVITVNDTNAVFLDKFEISGGNGVLGGGISFNNALLQLKDSIVHSNTATQFGGGVYAIHNANSINSTELKMVNSKILDNSSGMGGGGIYCKAGEILIDETSGVFRNQATAIDADGGGLYLEHCDLLSFAGTNKTLNLENIQIHKGISHNSASRHGGGIYATSTTIQLMGSRYESGPFVNNGIAEDPVSLNYNIADSDHNNTGNGGGVYIKGIFLSAASLEIHRGKVNNNSAYTGGAIYIGENTIFKMRRNRIPIVDEINLCWSDDCSVMSNNSAKYLGGAIFIEGGSDTTIGQTHITDNRANFGTVIALNSTDSSNAINMYQNFIYHNGRDGTDGFLDRSVFDIYNNSSSSLSNYSNISIKLNTITDNHATSSVFNMIGQNNNLTVLSSILHDPTTPLIGDLNGDFSTAIFDCIIANEMTSINVGFATLTRIEISDPGFEIRNYDYHIKPGATTVDYCDNSLTGTDQTLTSDIDDEPRAVDHPNASEFYGSWDLGADESLRSISEPRDVIFIDSFDWD